MITVLRDQQDSTKQIEFERLGNDVTIRSSDGENDFAFVEVKISYNELVEAQKALEVSKPNNQIEELSQAIQGLLRDYNFTVDGGIIDDRVAYDAFTANMLLMIDMYKNNHFGYDFHPFTIPDFNEESNVKDGVSRQETIQETTQETKI